MIPIYCLMVSGPGLSDMIRDVLYDTAQMMHAKGRSKQKIRHDDFEGQVTTEGNSAVIGGISGTVFSAVIETERTKTAVNYLVRPSDLCSEDGSWVTASSEPEFDPSNN